MSSDPTTMTASRPRYRRMVAGLSALPLAALIVLANPAGSVQAHAAAGPPGNNGTVKIDGKDFDTHPDNEPHVGCMFEVDFYGYDEGDLFAKVTFTAQAPTGKGEVLLTEDKVPIGEDDNSGGGSEVGIDAQRLYNLSEALVGYPKHAQQGYHVKLTVNADGSQGADTKHKVFWVRDCTPPATPGINTNPETNSNAGASGIPATNPATVGKSPSGADVQGDAITNPAPEAGAAVLGETITQPDVSARAGSLARTGSPIGATLLVAAILLTLGAVALRFGRAQATS